MSVELFRSVLARLGPDPTPRELAEILWLATRLPASAPSSAADAREADSLRAAAGKAGDTAPAVLDEEATADGEPAVPVHAPVAAPFVGDARRLSARPVRLAADPSLPHQLELLRALRPLKRRVPSRQAGDLDEEATLDAMAQRPTQYRRAALLPVLRPAPERWLDAVLVVDGHPTSLLLWTPLAREVHRLLIQLGAFRTVRVRYLHTRPDGSPGLSAHPTPHPDRIRGTSELHDPSGRRLLLVLTDAVAPGWQDPAVLQTMRRWAATGPLAVLQALPERLWRRTALPAVPAQLRRGPLSAANTQLAYTGRGRGTRELPEGSIPVPVLELSPGWLKPWAGLLAGSGSQSINAAVTLLAANPEPPRALADSRSPARRLQDFHATATPEAFRLMACLSAVPLSVSIMRVVQAAMLPGSPPTVLAEVMFSGLVVPEPTDRPQAPEDVPHDFLPGVRTALLESLRAHEVDQVIREVSRFVERYAQGAAGRVSGLLPDLAGSAELPADGIPWALLREEALVRAGLMTSPARAWVRSSVGDVVPGADRATFGPFRLVGFISTADFSSVHLAVDTEGKHATVKVRLPDSILRHEVSGALLRVEAEALRRMDSQYAPSLLGIDPTAPPAWMAMDYVTSVSGDAAENLSYTPWWGNGPSDNFHALSRLARELAKAIHRAHLAGVVHGNLSPHAVLLVPDTVVLISWVYAQFDGRPHPYPEHRARATGYLPPEGYPTDEPLNPSFDIYGLGAILLHEVTHDFSTSSAPRALSRLPSHLGDLRALIGRCLDPDPCRRPTARQLVDELTNMAAPGVPSSAGPLSLAPGNPRSIRAFPAATSPEPVSVSADIPRLIQGRYRLHELIGRGRMGEVWRALDESLGRRVAVKCLKPAAGRTGQSGDAGFSRILKERFRRGARVAAVLQHRSITVVHDFGEHEGVLFLVMELLDGRNLLQVLEDARRSPLPIPVITDIAEQVAAALAYAHRNGIVHRDLKPANIMRLADGAVKICDFGIARLGQDIGFTSRLTGSGVFMGTPHYMSPEQIGDSEVDHRSDLYSLGCVLYELATGAPPFDLGDAWSILIGHRDTEPMPPRAKRPELPVELEQLILDLLAKDPEDRPQDADDVIARLKAMRVNYRTQVSTPQTPQTPRSTDPSADEVHPLQTGSGPRPTHSEVPPSSIALYEQTLTDRVRVLGEDHPHTLTSRNDLAGAYESAGELGRAIALYEQTLTDRVRVLGEDHPHTLASRNNLAGAYQKVGDLGRAIPLYRRTLEDMVRVLGDSHPTTRIVAANLSAVLGRRGTDGPASQK